jgi:replicative DNA helicase
MIKHNLKVDLSSWDEINKFNSAPVVGDIESEFSLLAAIINNPLLLIDCNPSLEHKMFLNPINSLIFESMKQLETNKEQINEINIYSLTAIDIQFIIDLRLNKLLIASAKVLSQRVIDSYYTNEIKKLIVNPGFDLTLHRPELNQIIKANEKAKEDGETTTVHSLSKLLLGDTSQVFLQTGMYPIDSKLGGIAQAGLIVIAGRPKMGKTSFMVTMCLKSSNFYPVAYLTIEMNKEQITNKIRYIETEANYNNIQIIDYNYSLLDKIMIDISKLAGQGVKIFYLDYLQLIKTKYSAINEVASLSMITLELKLLAKRLNIVIVTGSQLSRGIETRDDKRPLKSDLKGSGSIEQDSDTIFALHRDNDDESLKPEGTKVQVYILANRHGKSGVINDFLMFPSGEFREETKQDIIKKLP